MVTLTTGIMFLLILRYIFGCGEFYDGGPGVGRQPMKWSATAESFRNTAIE
jgi:hypothetical protein